VQAPPLPEVPAGHLVQVVLPASEVVPSMQGVHTICPERSV
jgi:hypothetical protein